MAAGNLISDKMPYYNDGPLADVHEVCVCFIWPEICKKITCHSAHSETDSVEAILVPDDQGSFKDSLFQNMEDKGTGRKCDVHKNGEMVEPTSIKSEITRCWENIVESVDVTEDGECSKELVEENGVFLCD